MRKPSLLVIFLTVFIDLVGFGIVLPLLPQYSEQFGARGWEVGFIIASFSLMQFIFAPWWGRLSDRIGRRPVLLISTAGSALSYALFAVASGMTGSTGLLLLLASRMFAGLCGANISVASAYIADITTPQNRSKGMALIGVSFGLGFILGPALGAFSVEFFGVKGPGWLASVLCLGNFILASAILVESCQPGSAAAPRRARMMQWMHTLAQPKLGLLVVLYFLSTFCFACFETTLPLLVGSALLHRDDVRDLPTFMTKLRDSKDEVSQRIRAQLTPEFIPMLSEFSGTVSTALRRRTLDELNNILKSPAMFDERVLKLIRRSPATQKAWSGKPRPEEQAYRNRLVLQDAFPGEITPLAHYFDRGHIGYLFAYCGLLSAFIQGGAIGRLAKRYGESKMIAASLATVAISSLVIVYLTSLTGLLVGAGLFAMASGVTRAPTMALISFFSPEAEQGATMGVAQSAATLARVLGPPLASSCFYAREAWPFLLCALVSVFSAWLGWLYLVKTKADAGLRHGEATPEAVG